jgi:sodium-dependent dicarboxylate transporter 2/3/5
MALGALQSLGINLSFLEWMGFALPLTIILIILLWFFIYVIFKPRTPTIVIPEKDLAKLNGSQWVIAITVVTTIILWLTTKLHNIPTAVVALLPAIVFMGTGILTRDGLRNLGWDILLLLGGGLSLGVAVEVSGLSAYLADSIHLGAMGLFSIVLIFAAITILLSTFMSNTATVNLTVPLLLGFGGGAPVAAIIACALASSCAMALPISTPPNAIAYGSGLFRVSTMVRVGGAFSVIGFIVVVVLGYLLLSMFGYTNF